MNDLIDIPINSPTNQPQENTLPNNQNQAVNRVISQTTQSNQIVQDQFSAPSQSATRTNLQSVPPQQTITQSPLPETTQPPPTTTTVPPQKTQTTPEAATPPQATPQQPNPNTPTGGHPPMTLPGPGSTAGTLSTQQNQQQNLVDIPIQSAVNQNEQNTPQSIEPPPQQVNPSAISSHQQNPVQPNPVQPAISTNQQTPPQTTTNNPLDVPSVEEMQQFLQSSGSLLQEVSVQPQKQQQDTSPLAALQPQNMVNGPVGPQPINLPSNHEEKLNEVTLGSTYVAPPAINVNSLQFKIMKIVRTTTAVALTLQGLHGIYKSVKFILIDYPHLETLLVSDQISRGQINGFATKAVMMVSTTILGMFFALKIMRGKTGKKLNLIVGIILFFSSAYINNYLSSHFNVAALINAPIVEGGKTATSFLDKMIEMIPFLEKKSGEVTPVLYK